MADPPQKLIGSMAASKILGIDRATLTRWVKSGRITPRARIGSAFNATMVFDERDVRQLLVVIEQERQEEARRVERRAAAHADYLRKLAEIDGDVSEGAAV